MPRQKHQVVAQGVDEKKFVKQFGAWKKENERLIIVMDANEPTMDGPLRKMLERGGVELEIFLHK